MEGNLTISSAVKNLFTSAQTNPSIRFFQVEVNDEELVLGEVINRFSSMERDFNNALPESINNVKSTLLVFRYAEDTPSNWLLIGI